MSGMSIISMLYRHIRALQETGIVRSLQGRRLPSHIGVLVDGNRRWARHSGHLDLNEGHRVGAARVLDFIEWCNQLKIGYATFYLLSTDNLERSPSELAPLLKIIECLATELTREYRPCRVRVIGDLSRLPDSTSSALEKCVTETSQRDGGVSVNLMVGYSGPGEITEAVRTMLAKFAPDTAVGKIVGIFDSGDIAACLSTAGQPDPDLVIRTGGDHRLSGFLPWQVKHAELAFIDTMWPQLTYLDFLRVLQKYVARERRYGR